MDSCGQSKAGRPARTYIQQLCDDTGCNPEDLPEAMNNRETWRERGSGISVLAARHDDDDDDDILLYECPKKIMKLISDGKIKSKWTIWNLNLLLKKKLWIFGDIITVFICFCFFVFLWGVFFGSLVNKNKNIFLPKNLNQASRELYFWLVLWKIKIYLVTEFYSMTPQKQIQKSLIKGGFD